jgi:enediyne biosynthesis protein E3
MGIQPDEASFARRGFPMEAGARSTLEGAGRTFVAGYRRALDSPESVLRSGELEDVAPLDAVGFAYEGAAMALALLDALTPWRRDRLSRFLAGPARKHAYIAHVGAGWSYARFRFGYRRRWERLDPLLRWLAIDGLGFHEGYFHAERTIRRDRPRFRLEGYFARAFDQGLGRSLWFVAGAEPSAIARTIAGLAPKRHADLWSGVGLAAAYAGGVGRGELEALRPLADAHSPALAQGAAFAAEARRRAGNLVEHTELATQALCETSAEAAAATARRHLAGLEPENTPAYEVWRRRVQGAFSSRIERDACIGC